MISTLSWIKTANVSKTPVFEKDAQGQPPTLNAGAESKYEDSDDDQPVSRMEEDLGTEQADFSAEELAESMKLNMQLNEEMDPEDMDDYVIKDTDRVLVVAQAELEDVSCTLEVQVYDEEEGSIYIHHDVSLASFPLCIKTACFDAHKNACAVGMFSPIIEFFDLDSINNSEPLLQLGVDTTEKCKESHSDAVVSIDICKQFEKLVSGSADLSMKLWDIETASCIQSLDCFTDKVQKITVSPFEQHVNLASGFDNTFIVFNFAEPQSQSKGKPRDKSSALSTVSWSGHNAFQFLGGLDNGDMFVRDLRKIGQDVLRWQAHSAAITGISFNPSFPQIFATVSEDSAVILWDAASLNNAKEGVMNSGYLTKQEMNLGKIFDVGFCPDAPSVLAAGGEEGKLGVWDFSEEKSCKKILIK